MKIDAHQHFWSYKPERFAWINDEMKAIKHDFSPEDLESLLTRNGIEGCVAVQVMQTDEESAYLNTLAQKHDFIKGVVAWTDLTASSLSETLDQYKSHEKIKGFRHILQDENEDFFENPNFRNGVGKLAEYGYTYDILIKHHQMKKAKELIKACPYTHIVIDHLAKPDIKNGDIKTWANYMQKLADLPNVMCKVSGMVTEADWKNWKKEDFYQYLDVALASFGVDRLIYGSDWPVCLLASDYENQYHNYTQYFSKLTTTEQNKIFGLNAVGFYNL
jgi:L-fuconolactonase